MSGDIVNHPLFTGNYFLKSRIWGSTVTELEWTSSCICIAFLLSELGKGTTVFREYSDIISCSEFASTWAVPKV